MPFAEFKGDNRTFVYDFELMSLEQALVAETYFRIWEKTFKVLPATPDDLQLAMQQMALKNAYASILTEQNEDGSYKEFDTAIGGNIGTLKCIKGTVNRRKLEECKDDFFQKSGLATPNSTESLQNLMHVIKEMPRPEQELMYGLILQSVSGQAGNSYVPNSILAEQSADGLGMS